MTPIGDSPPPARLDRRRALGLLTGAAAGAAFPVASWPAGCAEPGKSRSGLKLRYVLASCMYGKAPLEDVLPEVAKTGSCSLDLWGLPHGDQREQVDRIGVDAFAELLASHGVELSVSTRYPLGPFGLQAEMPVLRRLGGRILVCGTTGPSEPSGEDAKRAVRDFLEKMKPHVEAAEDHGLVIAVENHDRQLLYHPDSLRWFAEFNRSSHLGVALAFHHLHAFAAEIPTLIRDLGNSQLPFIYFQEHSEGIRSKVAKEIELRQLPGFGGSLDYRPILEALDAISYSGLVELFMHPTPRGIPILPTIREVTAAINRSRAHIEDLLDELA